MCVVGASICVQECLGHRTVSIVPQYHTPCFRDRVPHDLELIKWVRLTC